MLHRRHHNRLKQILYISISITASPANKSPNVSLLVNLIPLIVLHVHPVFHLDKKDKETNLKFCPQNFSESTECKKKKKNGKAANHLLRLYSRESFFEQMMQEILFDLCVKEMN